MTEEPASVAGPQGLEDAAVDQTDAIKNKALAAVARRSSCDLGPRDGVAPLWMRSIRWITGAEAGAGRVVLVEGVEDQPRGGAPPRNL
jgi:hypothetical protein